MKRIQIFCGTGFLHYLPLAHEFVRYPRSRTIELVGGMFLLPSWLLRFLSMRLKENVASRLLRNQQSLSNVPFLVRSLFLPELISATSQAFNLSPRFEIWIRTISLISYRSMNFLFIKSNSVVIVRSGYAGRLFFSICKKKGCRVIVDHSIAHPNTLLSLEQCSGKSKIHLLGLSLFWSFVKSDLVQASEIQVNSEFVKQDLLSDPLLREIPMKVNYIGVNYDCIPKKENYSLIKPFFLKITFSGGFHFRKGADRCLILLSMLLQRGIDFRFDVYGVPDDFYRNIFIHQFGPRVHFYGHIPKNKLLELLNESDLYVFPSRCEGCASSVIEALAAGLPVLTTIQSGAPIKNGLNGILFDEKFSPDSLESIISNVLDDGLRSRIGKAGADYVRGNLTWARYVTCFFRNYDIMGR